MTRKTPLAFPVQNRALTKMGQRWQERLKKAEKVPKIGDFGGAK